MALSIEQGSEYQGEDWWRWWVWIDGPDDELDDVDHVVYTLHRTFPKPVRTVRDRASKFRLETGGWGVFVVYAAAVHADGRETHLELMLDFEVPDGYAINDPLPKSPSGKITRLRLRDTPEGGRWETREHVADMDVVDAIRDAPDKPDTDDAMPGPGADWEG